MITEHFYDDYIAQQELSVCLTLKHYAMKACGGSRCTGHVFLILLLVGGEWSSSRSTLFTPGGEASYTHMVEVLVRPRTGLDDVKNRKFLSLPVLEFRSLGRPAPRRSLYRLRCPGLPISCIASKNYKSAICIPRMFT
jgi:hypothetical protein